jgi:TolB-like protein/Tfp pilus assembly protein PilF
LNVGGLRRYLFGGAGAGQIRSLAVLPLENISRDPEQEYFTDGMTQELIANLGKIAALRVISRSSVMSLKQIKKPLPEIARMLNVDAVVEGSAVRFGDRVRITAALVQATPERQLWSDSYERDAQDVLALQAEVAREIAQQIRVRLAPGERARLASPKPVIADAYEAYLRGRVYLEREDWGQNQKAIAMFQKAIDLQPTFALAWAGLADAHYTVSNTWVPPRDAMPKARSAAKKALELDPNLSEAHAVMGAITSQFDWDWDGTEREYREAIRLNPSNANAHLYYAFMLAATSRMNQAIAQGRRAQELNPLSAITAGFAPTFYYLAGEYDSALVVSRRLIQSEPANWQHHGIIAGCYDQVGKYDEAIEEARKMVSLSGGSFGHGALAHAYAYAGRRREAMAELGLSRRADSLRGTYFWPTEAAGVCARLGDTDRAFKWLDKAYEDRSEGLVWVNVDPVFRPLRSDPRFQDLLVRIGLRPQ